jgi:hypothetical protein
MEPGQKVILTEDIFSLKKDKKGNPWQYGRKGENVKLIAVHDKVVILERASGDRFPALLSQIKKL